MTGRARPAGDRAVLVELDDLSQVVALDRRLMTGRPRGVVDVIPAARTVLVEFDPKTVSAQVISQWLAGKDDTADPPAETDATDTDTDPDTDPDKDSNGTLEIPVHYDGADLAEVAGLLGCTERELVQMHTGTVFTVAFCGFAPGFGYLTGLPPGLRVPRRTSPRNRVPAGSVALADGFTGVYPRESPGGWQLIGRTDTVVFDLDRDPPALLTPGTRVRFVEATP